MRKLFVLLGLALAVSGLAEAAPGDLLRSVPSGAAVHGAVAPLPEGGWCAGNLSGELFCLDAGGRRRTLTLADGPLLNAPLVQRGRLVVASTHGVQAFALADGKPLWRLALPPLPAPVLWDAYMPDPLPLGEEDLLVAHGRELLRLNAADGKPRWRLSLDAAVIAQLQLQGGSLWLADVEGRLLKIDPASGAVRQRWAAAQGLIQGAPALREDGWAWITGRDARVRGWRLDGRNGGGGAQVWEADHGGNWIMAAPLLLGEQLIVAESDGFLIQAYRARDGQRLWHFGLGQNVFQAPVVDGERLLVASGRAYQADAQGLVTAIGAGGELLWQRALPANAFGRPLLVGRRLVVGTENGQVHEIAVD
ncbi:PQQ-binding-like beta-propeller repeat protein [Roseateles violae]|uniref:PQQ-binding-like beta-propeller repeat protein n=1 Tax=Roseateles violae TaxID=3058042 RepID=A0ABT8DWP7_9BURK|nr:PQQ-binding-like beta-propeller repeat protein [Pelomonas sp. PFR6]MDN3922458.1 PQQ-binding-like beta-propeller repeat protein [Pelomonas sp. PFR6]